MAYNNRNENQMSDQVREILNNAEMRVHSMKADTARTEAEFGVIAKAIAESENWKAEAERLRGIVVELEERIRIADEYVAELEGQVERLKCCGSAERLREEEWLGCGGELEKEKLKKWKEEAKVLLDKWDAVDAFVRGDPRLTIGDSVVDQCYAALVRERDQRVGIAELERRIGWLNEAVARERKSAGGLAEYVAELEQSNETLKTCLDQQAVVMFRDGWMGTFKGAKEIHGVFTSGEVGMQDPALVKKFFAKVTEDCGNAGMSGKLAETVDPSWKDVAEKVNAMRDGWQPVVMAEELARLAERVGKLERLHNLPK